VGVCVDERRLGHRLRCLGSLSRSLSLALALSLSRSQMRVVLYRDCLLFYFVICKYSSVSNFLENTAENSKKLNVSG
jgi:uncharacterized SAM-binding protein YcdF (DUF218 family)